MITQTETADEIEQLWDVFTVRRDTESRDRLLLHYLPLVKKVAGRVKIGLPGSVEYDDLVSAGLMGLINSVDHFKPERGIRFETYAGSRIRGSMLDSLRDIDWLPRSYRQKSRRFDEALTDLVNKLGRIPNDDEIAVQLGLNLEEYHQFLDQIGTASLVSLDARMQSGEGGESGSLHDVIPDISTSDPYRKIEENNAKETALKLIEELTEQERSVIALYYYEELTLKEIGQVLGVSESRVCQIHTRIIAILRVRLRKLLE